MNKDDTKRSERLLGSELGINLFYSFYCTYGLFPNDYKSINPFSSSKLCHKLISANLSRPGLMMETQTRILIFLPNQAYPGNNCITCSPCLILRLQMATIAKPKIMHVCNMHFERTSTAGWLAGWQQIELRGNVPFNVTWPHPAEPCLIPRAAVWLLVQSCSRGKNGRVDREDMQMALSN